MMLFSITLYTQFQILIHCLYLFKVIKLNKKFNIYPCHCCFISEFFLCSYLFHYISEDRIIYLCISDDVSYKTFQKVKLQEIIFNFKTYIFVKNFLKRICWCNILKTLLLKKYLIDYQVKLPNYRKKKIWVCSDQVPIFTFNIVYQFILTMETVVQN